MTYEKHHPRAPARFLDSLRRNVKRTYSIKEAAALCGYKSSGFLYKRLEGHCHFPVAEMLNLVRNLQLDLSKILVDAGFIAPSVSDLKGLLLYFADTNQAEDEDIRRLLAFPPPKLGSAEGVGSVPQKFLDMDDLRIERPETFQSEVGDWRATAYRTVLLAPSIESYLDYCCALSLTAVDLAKRSRVPEAAVVLAHALEVAPRRSGVTIQLQSQAGSLLRMFGQFESARIIAQGAHSQAVLNGDAVLEAKCLLALAAVYVAMAGDDNIQLAKTSYLRVLRLAPHTRLELDSAINIAYLEIDQGNPAGALQILGRIGEHVEKYPTVHFYRSWIEGRAYAQLSDDLNASASYCAALDCCPEVQDPINLMLVFDSLRQLKSLSVESLSEVARELVPFVQPLERKSPPAARIARRILTAFAQQVASTAVVDDMMRRLRKLSSKGI